MAATLSPELRRDVSVGFLLICLYTFCVLMVVVSFSAYVMRTDWDSGLSADGNDLRTLDKLGFMLKREETLIEEIAAIKSKVAEADARIIDLTRAQAEMRMQLDAATRSRDETLSAAQVHLSRAPTFLDDEEHMRMSAFLPAEGSDWTEDSIIRALLFVEGIRVDQQVASLEEKHTFGPPDQFTYLRSRGRERAAALTTTLREQMDSVLQSELRLSAADSDLDRGHESRSDYVKEQNTLMAALGDLRVTVPVDSEHRARHSEFFGSVSWWNPMPELVRAPTILLTLIATIAAGALGTLVSFSRSTFQQKPAPTTGRLLIIIGEGVAAAIAVFLFAGAGMLVLSQGGGPDGRLELSPFTVAFLAFLSGFMSEQAFDNIRKKGRDLFGEQPEDSVPG